MFHFCIFGGHEGELNPNKRVFVTVFGGCELRRPTLARQLVMARRQGGNRVDGGAFFLTLFGGTELTVPTLTEEFLDLQEAVRAGLLTVEEWDRHVAQFGLYDHRSYASFTAFGGFDSEALPEEDAELDRLALARHVGAVPDRSADVLMLAVGGRGPQRSQAVRHAYAAALA